MIAEESSHDLQDKREKSCMKVPNETMETSQVGLVVKSPPARRCRDTGSAPGSGRSPGEGRGHPLQYSCLGNPLDREPGGLQSTGSHGVGAHDKSKRWHGRDTERIRTERKLTTELPWWLGW